MNKNRIVFSRSKRHMFILVREWRNDRFRGSYFVPVGFEVNHARTLIAAGYDVRGLNVHEQHVIDYDMRTI